MQKLTCCPLQRCRINLHISRSIIIWLFTGTSAGKKMHTITRKSNLLYFYNYIWLITRSFVFFHRLLVYLS